MTDVLIPSADAPQASDDEPRGYGEQIAAPEYLKPTLHEAVIEA